MTTRRNPSDLDFGADRSAPLAYRKDLAAAPGRENLDPGDGTWIAIATLLCHASEAQEPERAAMLDRSAALAREALPEGAGPPTRRPGQRMGRPPTAPLVRQLVSRMEDAGALNLALTTLQAFAKADPTLDTLEHGRIVALGARIAWKTGDLDAAKKRYAAVARMATRSGEIELRVRAWIGYSVLARLHGNYPDVQKWASRAARAAEREGLDELGAIAHHSLTVVAGGRGEIEKALLHGWRAYQLSAGDRTAEAQMLMCLGQTLLNAGDAATARSGFAAALIRNPPARLALPAFGGYAAASAKVGDREGVRWASAQVLRHGQLAGVPYASAAALTECAAASVAVGDVTRAAPLREAALSVARAHGYHEIAFQLDDIAAPSPGVARGPLVLSAGAAAIVRAVHRVQPDTTPRSLAKELVRV